MQKPNKFQLASIAAASILVGYIAVAASMQQPTRTAKELDLPAILSAQGASVDYYLKIEGVDGESTNDKHKGQIELESWSWGETNRSLRTSSSGSGTGTGKVSVQDFHFTMKVNKATPKLMLACATGEHFSMATLTIVSTDRESQEYFTVTLTDVLVTSYRVGGSSASPVPTDSISLNFAKIEFEYKPQSADGTLDAPVKAGYDVKAQKSI